MSPPQYYYYCYNQTKSYHPIDAPELLYHEIGAE